MPALDPAVAAVRLAVRRGLRADGLRADGLRGDVLHGDVLVACSGGADSLALAAAAAFVGPRAGHRVGLVTVDHQLQPGSAERAARVAQWAAAAGLAPVVVSTVDVGGRTGGPEAAARDARYEALVAAATGHGIGIILLGHTREDQAETVLLALVRGSGPHGLAGMPEVRTRAGVRFVRPLLDVSRAQTRAAAGALGLPVWDDPHNVDPAYRRTQARALLTSLVDSLGPVVVANLARTARLAAADTAYLDDLAAEVLAKATGVDGLRLADLVGTPDALRTRVLHAFARSLGVPGSALAYRHVAALDALLTDWHGQGAVWLPGGIAVVRREGRLSRMDHLDPPRS
jgi:tRNA(Ile)-lysidine synthase